jgi:hypothetical protein
MVWLPTINSRYFCFVRSHEKSFLVVYEELCTNPHEKATKIFDFVGWKIDQVVHDFILIYPEKI